MTFSSGAVAVLPAFTTLELPNLEIDAPKEVKSENYEPITDSENVEKFLKDYFTDMPLLAKIGACESHNRHLNSKGEVLRGRKNIYDRGVMQINILYHEKKAREMGLDLHNLDDNVAFARYLYEKFGAKPWKSSSACWAKFAPREMSEIAQKASSLD